MGWLDRIPGRGPAVVPLRCRACGSITGYVPGKRLVCRRCGHAGNFRETVRLTHYEKLLLYLGVR